MFKLIVVGLLAGLRLVAYLFSFSRMVVLNEASWSIKSLPIIALPDAVDNGEGFYYLPFDTVDGGEGFYANVS